jgi:hypothetical protein
MSDTPRTDLAYKNSTGAGIYELFKEAQEIERELNAANTQIGLLIAGSKQQERQIEFLKEKIQRLVEAGDAMFGVLEMYGEEIRREWDKAKDGL